MMPSVWEHCGSTVTEVLSNVNIMNQKETNSGLFFSDQISIHFGSTSQNVVKCALKKSHLGANLTHFGA